MSSDEMWDVGRAGDPGDWFDAARDAVAEVDPEVRVRAVAVLKDRLPDVEYHAVMAARQRGAMWSRIGEALGMSRQAVCQRFGRRSRRTRPRTREMVERRLAWAAIQAELERQGKQMFARMGQNRR